MMGKSEQTIDDDSYYFIRDLILQQAGISLAENKKSMIQSRLSKRIIALKIKNIADYLSYLKHNKEELSNFINALTTNKTDFFREVDHFNILLEKFLPELVQKYNNQKKVIMFWSAACSSGPEAYTISMIIMEFLKGRPNLDYKILGSDIDTDIIKKAELAIYPEEDVSHIPQKYISGNFVRGTGSNSGLYKITDRLKDRVKFRQYNLIDSVNTLSLNFDYIFLRNVLIYFQLDIIQKVIDNVTNRLLPGGLLFIGHAETLNGVKHDLIPMGSSIYKKKL